MRDQLVTPAFIIDAEELKTNMNALKKALADHWGRAVIGYSYKTNSLPWILHFMQSEGCYAEVVSETEYELAGRMGHRDTIIYNGPVKGRPSFMRALERQNVINVDSFREIRWIREHGTEGIRADIGIRVNFDLEKVCPGETVAGEGGSRFGFHVESRELDRAVQSLMETGIKIAGLHMHVSTKSRSLEIYRQLARKAAELAAAYGWRLKYVDIGGGFFAGGSKCGAYAEYVRAIAEELNRIPNREELLLIVEPGASLIASPVRYLTGVVDVKNTAGSRFVVTDGSRLHIDPFMARNQYSYQTEPVSGGPAGSAGRERTSVRRQVVCGYTCMEKDRIMVLENCPALEENDRILYDCVGSYTMTLNSLFIDYLPNVYVREKESYRLVREKWGIDEFMQKCRLE